MKYIYSILCCCMAFASGAVAQDSCEDALPITIGTHTVEQVDGNQPPNPECATGFSTPEHGEWYTYTPSEDHGLTIATQSTGWVDTRVNVYSGGCENLSCVAGDDDSGSGQLSMVNLNVEAGTTYTIVFDDAWSAQGFDFELTQTGLFEDPPVTFASQSVGTSGSMRAVVDINDDQLDDIVSVGSNNVNVNYQLSDGNFGTDNIPTPDADNTPSWSLAAGDLDDNGYIDFVYGGGSGVTLMLRTDDGSTFEEISFPEYVFSQRSNMVDINNDGHLDVFVCHDVDPNVYFINDGEGNFEFNQGGLGDTPDGGNYGSIWIDYDNDHDVDLFIAKCRGGDSPANINQMHRNNGDGTFTEVAEEINLADDIQTWSSAWGDFDNDGDMDVLVGASSDYNGLHKLMQNDGEGNFTDITEGSGYDLFDGTENEHTTHDFDNDGYLDVLGGSNTIMFNNGDMTFTPHIVGVGEGPIGDLNNDGFLDIMNQSTIKMNQGNENNHLKIHTVGTASNAHGIGARVEIYTPNLGKQIRDVKSGDGFRYMSSLTTHFGIGTEEVVDSIKIYWPSGIVDNLYDGEFEINSTITIVEGENQDTVSVGEFADEDQKLILFPNPAGDILMFNGIETTGQKVVNIYDIAGKHVFTERISGNVVNISTLESGSYILKIEADGRTLQKQFIKD